MLDRTIGITTMTIALIPFLLMFVFQPAGWMLLLPLLGLFTAIGGIAASSENAPFFSGLSFLVAAVCSFSVIISLGMAA